MNPPPPPPAGEALLGLGNSFTVPGGGARMRMTEGNGSSWISFVSVYSGNSDHEYYCAPINSDVVAANRELVERLNPRIIFPWQMESDASPATPPEPVTVPIQRNGLPDNQAILGIGGTFVHDGTRSPYLGWAITVGRMEGGETWIDSGAPFGGSGVRSYYATASDSPIAAANQEIVERLNPGMIFPWTMELAPEPVTAAPTTPYPPLPEGQVLLGRGGEFQLIRPHEHFTGWYFKTLAPASGWQAGTSIGDLNQDVWYCAPADSPIVRHNAPVVPVASPARTFRGYTPEQGREFYANFSGSALRNLPTGHVLMGWLDELDYDPTISFQVTWSAMSSWAFLHGAFTAVGRDHPEKILVCALPDSELALRNPEAVAFYNPALAPVTPVQTFPAIPFAWPTLEGRYAGWLVLGMADTIVRPPGGRTRGAYFENGSTGWEYSRSLSTACTYELQAFEPNSPEVALNLEAARFYNPGAWIPSDPVANPVASTQVFTPIVLRDNPGQRLPADTVLIGRPPELNTASTENCFYTSEAGQWISAISVILPRLGLSGYLCGPLNSALAQANLESVWFHNPHLRPVADIATVVPQAPAVKLFHLSFNGAPVASLEEFVQTITPLVRSANLVAELSNVIWDALSYVDPESRIDAWTEREPVVLAGIDFHRIVVTDEPVEVLAVAGSERSISEIITRAAAGVLLRGGLVNHFQYLESGELVVNPENPPSLEQGYEIIRRTLEIKETSQKLDNYSAWTLGMLGDQMERLFGDAFDVSMVLAQTTRAYNTYITSLGVFRACWATKRHNLSYTHHKEAYYAKVEEPQKEFILDTSSALGLTVADQRKLTSYVRHYGSEGLEESMPETTAELMERCEVRAVNKNYMFFLRSQNKWFNYRGPFENIPNGADPILNADTRAKLSREGIPEAMDVWVPVGVEVPARRGHSATIEANRVAAVESDGEVERSHGGGTGQTLGTGDFTIARDPSAEVVAAESPWTEEESEEVELHPISDPYNPEDEEVAST